MLSTVSDIVTIVGFPLALIGIYLAYREGRNSRDLDAALDLSESTFGRWFFIWRKVVGQFEKLPLMDEASQSEFADEISGLLNWLDSVGYMVDSHQLARPEKVLPSMSRTMKDMITGTESVLAAYERRDGLERWHGVRLLKQTLDSIELHSSIRSQP